jgi:restriction endonuclease S subunit
MQWRLMLDVGGSAVKHLYITKIAGTRFFLPPIDQQQRCVEQLNAVERSFRNIQERKQSVRLLARRLLLELGA